MSKSNVPRLRSSSTPAGTSNAWIDVSPASPILRTWQVTLLSGLKRIGPRPPRPLACPTLAVNHHRRGPLSARPIARGLLAGARFVTLRKSGLCGQRANSCDATCRIGRNLRRFTFMAGSRAPSVETTFKERRRAFFSRLRRGSTRRKGGESPLRSPSTAVFECRLPSPASNNCCRLYLLRVRCSRPAQQAACPWD